MNSMVLLSYKKKSLVCTQVEALQILISNDDLLWI